MYPCVDERPGLSNCSAKSPAISNDSSAARRRFYRIRPYESLESARHVDSKATAHTGDLQSAPSSPASRTETLTIFLDLDVNDAVPAWFEHVISAARSWCGG